MKGFMKTLEASIAVVLILGAAVALNNASPSYPERNLMEIGNDCLSNVHNGGLLDQYAMSGDDDGLSDALGDCIPKSLNYEVKICHSSDCSADGLPSDRTVVLSSRLISGDYHEFNPSVVNLWMWS